MKFKDFIEMTSTANVAGFKRMSLPMARRTWPPSMAVMIDQDPPGKKKKPYKVPQVEEGVKDWAKKYKVDTKALKDGVDVEAEHDGKMGKDTDVVGPKEDKAKIATAHLREDPKYYKKLKKIEKD